MFLWPTCILRIITTKIFFLLWFFWIIAITEIFYLRSVKKKPLQYIYEYNKVLPQKWSKLLWCIQKVDFNIWNKVDLQVISKRNTTQLAVFTRIHCITLLTEWFQDSMFISEWNVFYLLLSSILKYRKVWLSIWRYFICRGIVRQSYSIAQNFTANYHLVVPYCQ